MTNNFLNMRSLHLGFILVSLIANAMLAVADNEDQLQLRGSQNSNMLPRKSFWSKIGNIIGRDNDKKANAVTSSDDSTSMVIIDGEDQYHRKTQYSQYMLLQSNNDIVTGKPLYHNIAGVYLVQHIDGNLQLVKGSIGYPEYVLWESGYNGFHTQYFSRLTSHGDLVTVIHGETQPVWSTHTTQGYAPPKPYFMSLTSDYKTLYIFEGTTNAVGNPIWSFATNYVPIPPPPPPPPPVVHPTPVPTCEKTPMPTCEKTPMPTCEKTPMPTCEKTPTPTCEKTQLPTCETTPLPTCDERGPTPLPTCETALDTPSSEPSEEPSSEPSEEPSEFPSEEPSEFPSEEPSETPSEEPSEEPTSTSLGAISGTIFLIVNENFSIRRKLASPDFDDKPCPNIIVQLVTENINNVIATVRTDEKGYFIFPNLPEGTYYIVVPENQPNTCLDEGSLVENVIKVPLDAGQNIIVNLPIQQAPSASPTISSSPTVTPTEHPSEFPSSQPTSEPTISHKPSVSSMPSESPTEQPSESPTEQPSESPSESPSEQPSESPSARPTGEPSSSPSGKPSISSEPSATPSVSTHPSFNPSSSPSSKPSSSPSTKPTLSPSTEPSSKSSSKPSVSTKPSSSPSSKPSLTPSSKPSLIPSSKPSVKPSLIPSSKPSAKPSLIPSSKPSSPPTVSNKPTVSNSPSKSSAPSRTPTSSNAPSKSSSPSSNPTVSSKPSLKPSMSPTSPTKRCNKKEQCKKEEVNNCCQCSDGSFSDNCKSDNDGTCVACPVK